MSSESKPQILAVIREEECIGCTKCIQACPVDAILGSSRQMHTVITDECIGCKLCLPPCPVDCIDLITLEKPEIQRESIEERKQKAAHIKKRYLTRQKRLAEGSTLDPLQLEARRNYVRAAVARAQRTKM